MMLLFVLSSNKCERYGFLSVFHVIFQQFYDPKITVSMARTSNGTQVRKVSGSMLQTLYLLPTIRAGYNLLVSIICY
jgi:hypothetical protein